MVVQDIFLTATAEIADVVLPAAAAWAETEGTVTNSERRVQRVRKALDPPGDARDDLWIIYEIARRMGHDWGEASAEAAWNELRTLSPGARRDELRAPRGRGRAPVAVLRRGPPGRALPPLAPVGRPGARQPGAVRARGARGPGRPLRRRLPGPAHHRPPARLLQHGVQSGGFRYPRRRRSETLDLCPEDLERFGLAEGEVVRVVSRRGAVEAPVRADRVAAARASRS